MILSKFFLICTFKDPNLPENLTNLAEDLLKNELRGVYGVFFSQVWLQRLCLIELTRAELRDVWTTTKAYSACLEARQVDFIKGI